MHSIPDNAPTTPSWSPEVTDAHPNYDQNPTPYLQALALTALYFLIRTMGGQPEDACALTALASPLLAIRL